MKVDILPFSTLITSNPEDGRYIGMRDKTSAAERSNRMNPMPIMIASCESGQKLRETSVLS